MGEWEECAVRACGDLHAPVIRFSVFQSNYSYA